MKQTVRFTNVLKQTVLKVTFHDCFQTNGSRNIQLPTSGSKRVSTISRSTKVQILTQQATSTTSQKPTHSASKERLQTCFHHLFIHDCFHSAQRIALGHQHLYTHTHTLSLSHTHTHITHTHTNILLSASLRRVSCRCLNRQRTHASKRTRARAHTHLSGMSTVSCELFSTASRSAVGRTEP